MAKYFLYLLLSFFILLNGLVYFENEVKHILKKDRLLTHKLAKKKLYEEHSEEVLSILEGQKKILAKNQTLFFDKDKKETIVYSKIQTLLQGIARKIDAKIIKLDTGTVVSKKHYKKYLISLKIELIPEDMNLFFKHLSLSEHYYLIDSLYIARLPRKGKLLLQLTLVGYQLK